jgi:hypothetical protein
MVAAVPAPPSAVKTEDGSQAAALPLPQPAFKEVDENLPATVPPSQSELKEEQKPAIAIPLSQPVVKKEDKKLVAAIPLSRSAVKEDEKPAASIAPPRSAVMENIPKHTQVTTEQDIAPETTEQRPLELPPKNIVNSLDLLFLYPTCYFCSYVSLQECKCAPFVFNVTAFGEAT